MRGENRLYDVVIARAAAEIAFKFFADRFLVETVLVALDDTDGAHHHAGGAETALQGMVFTKRFLHGMQFVAVGEAFDRRDVGAFELTGEDRAGLDRPPI